MYIHIMHPAMEKWYVLIQEESFPHGLFHVTSYHNQIKCVRVGRGGG